RGFEGICQKKIDIESNCACRLVARKRKSSKSAFPALLGEQRKFPRGRQSDANDPQPTQTLRAGCQDSAMQRGVLATAVCYPLGSGPTPIQSTHGEVQMSLRRREFITVFGGVAAWPLAARAQQGERMRRIGALMNVTSDDPESSFRVAAFSQGLQELGWSVGRNVRIDWRWAGADRERARTYAVELVALAPEVVLTSGLGVRPMLQATRTVPIVFAGLNDPVGAGVVRSLARPGGNITGFA